MMNTKLKEEEEAEMEKQLEKKYIVQERTYERDVQ